VSIRYKILENNTVEVFYDDSEELSLSQPTYPNGDPFLDKEDANSWALLYVASVENKSALFAPNGLNQMGEQKPTEKEISYGHKLIFGE